MKTKAIILNTLLIGGLLIAPGCSQEQKVEHAAEKVQDAQEDLNEAERHFSE
ncbi:MAG: hypothetical protein JNL60_14245, partial [Bacteroidia bacterium]|nr:hypothetical protein [Bacteroidia bacterium]